MAKFSVGDKVLVRTKLYNTEEHGGSAWGAPAVVLQCDNDAVKVKLTASGAVATVFCFQVDRNMF